jgi:hypothetical protein
MLCLGQEVFSGLLLQMVPSTSGLNQTSPDVFHNDDPTLRDSLEDSEFGSVNVWLKRSSRGGKRAPF